MNKRNVLILLLLMGSIFLGYAENLNAAESPLDKGISEFKAENYEEALGLFIKAREREPGSPMAAFYLGLTYKQMGEYRDASKHLRDAIRLSPSVKEAYPELIQVLYNLNELKEAMDWITLAEKEEVKPGSVAFLKGRVLLKQGRNKEAIEAFRKAKGVDPSLAQSSDFQIAMAYAREKKFAEAKESLKALISVDPTSELASFAREYEDAFTRGVQLYKVWRVTAGIAYQFDDNVVLKPSRSIPDVLITGERDSSVITAFRFSYTPPLRDPWFFNAQYNFYANTYFSHHKVNLIQQAVSFIPGYNFQKGALTLPLAYTYAWLHGKQYMWVLFAKPTVNFMFLPNHIGQLSVGYTRREMHETPTDRHEDRDGNIYSVSPGYVYSFKNGRGIFNFRYEFSMDNTEGKNWENTGNRINLSLLLPVMDKLSFTISGEMFLQDYQHTHTFFGMKRSDRTYYGGAGMRWEVLKGLTLSLQYSHTHADSNISVYEYKRNVYTTGLEYTF